MKRTLFTFFCLTTLILLNFKTYGQQKNTVAVVYGTGSDGLIGGGIGSAGYSSRGFNMVGFDYMYHFNRLFAIETGLEYSNNNLLWDYEDAYDPTFKPQSASIKMLSIPVCGNFTFFKYLFLDAGFSIDIETDHPAERLAPEQSGIGMVLGAGGKYTFKHIFLFVNPFFQAHSIYRFSSSGGQNLTNSGFKFGIGYGF